MDDDRDRNLAADMAQVLHDRRRLIDPDHDQGSCWCCCLSCRWNFHAVMIDEVLLTDPEPPW